MAPDVLGELDAHVVDRAGGVLGHVVQRVRDLDVLGIAGVARDIGDRLGVGQPLARCGADIVVGVQQQRDGVDPASGLAHGDSHAFDAHDRTENGGPPVILGCAVSDGHAT